MSDDPKQLGMKKAGSPNILPSFKKAARKANFIRLALCGASGSGKTFSALMLARGLVGNGKIAVIDTERASSNLYSDLAEFDTADLEKPYTPKRYIGMLDIAAQSGYSVVIVDSLSHAWVGAGGVLDMHDTATRAQSKGNSFMAWRDVTPEHNALIDAMLACPFHLIVTMRSKTAYEMDNEGGKNKPRKIGLAPVQREGMDYEFTTVFDLSLEGNIASVSKDRTRLWSGRQEVIQPYHGEEFANWLLGGEKYDLDLIASKLTACSTTDEIDSIWRNLSPVPIKAHVQYNELVEIFIKAKTALMKQA
jgi:hypothetical protein